MQDEVKLYIAEVDSHDMQIVTIIVTAHNEEEAMNIIHEDYIYSLNLPTTIRPLEPEFTGHINHLFYD